MPSENAIVPHKPLVKASSELSAFLGMEPAMMIDTIKAQCFKGKRPEEVSDAQLATYISVANALKLNPLLPGMMYPFPDRNGAVTVMLGPDGVYTLLANNSDIVATKDGGPAWWTEHAKDGAGKETCTAYVNHRTKGLLKKTIWVDEWVVSSNPNWSSRRHHMAETRALKQVTRMVIHGVPFDDDERRISEEVNVTNTADHSSTDKPSEPVGGPGNVGDQTVKKRGRPPGRSATGAAAVVETEAKADDKAIDVHTTPTAETPKTETTTKEPVSVATKATPAAAEPVTSMELNETKVFVGCEVVELEPKNFGTPEKPRLAVKVTLKGAFTGLVYDTRLGSASWVDDKDPTKGVKPCPPWQLEHPVTVTLIGKLRPSDQAIVPTVKEAELSEGAVQEAGELP